MLLQAFLRDEVQSFKPQPSDLDYPQCLMRAQQSNGAANAAAQGDANAPQTLRPDGSGEGAAEDTSTWYPPLKSTLMCLSKLYNCVDPQAFSGLGQDALYNCTHAIQQAGALIEKKAGQRDAQLFTIRHLLILREQISSFQVDFRACDRDLDFTHVRGQLQRLLAGEVPLFQASQTAASLQLVATGSLRVQENQIDGKKELEKALKSKCEAFIMSLTKLAVEPMLSFVTKVNALSQVGKVRFKCLCSIRIYFPACDACHCVSCFVQGIESTAGLETAN
jgi:conserved oligomeric Golgi complex subunit 3